MTENQISEISRSFNWSNSNWIER